MSDEEMQDNAELPKGRLRDWTILENGQYRVKHDDDDNALMLNDDNEVFTVLKDTDRRGRKLY